MQKYIYKITSPSNKIYIGQSTIPINRKIDSYRKMELYNVGIRKIVSAIQKHKWENMLFEVIEENTNWSTYELDQHEIYWISFYDSVNTGYNMTTGGGGVNSECARALAINHHASMSDEKKEKRKINCSKGQLKRYQEMPDSEKTRKQKSESHKGTYKIESPDGRVWVTDNGLKDFADQYNNEIKISYWQLFNAYRKCYNKETTKIIRKNINTWKVTRIDKPDN
jgi:hypothetical protein